MERTYVVPLRRGWLKAPKYRRAKKAVTTLREFFFQHMKSKEVHILPDLNLAMWAHGMKNPPSRIKVTAIKDDKGVVRVQVFGKSLEVSKEEPKVQKKAVKKEPESAKSVVVPLQEKLAESVSKEETPKKAYKKTVKNE